MEIPINITEWQGWDAQIQRTWNPCSSSFHAHLSFCSHLPHPIQVLATLLNWPLLWSQAMMLQSLGSPWYWAAGWRGPLQCESPGGRMGWSCQRVPTLPCWQMGPWWSATSCWIKEAALQMRVTMSVWLRTALDWWLAGRLESRQQVSGCSYLFFSPQAMGDRGVVPSYAASGALISQHGSVERCIAVICGGRITAYTHLSDWYAIWHECSQTLLWGEGKRNREQALSSSWVSVS